MNWFKKILSWFSPEEPPPRWHEIRLIIQSGYVRGHYDCSNMSASVWGWYRVHTDIKSKCWYGYNKGADTGHAWVCIRKNFKKWYIDPAKRNWSKKNPSKEYDVAYSKDNGIILRDEEWTSPFFIRDNNGNIKQTVKI